MVLELIRMQSLNQDAVELAEEAHIATTPEWISFFHGYVELHEEVRLHVYGIGALTASEQVELIDTVMEFLMGHWLINHTFNSVLELWDVLPEFARGGNRTRMAADIRRFQDSDDAWGYVDAFVYRHLYRKFDPAQIG